MILYLPKKQRPFSPETGPYTSFGIGAWQLGAGAAPLAFIPDVSPDGKAVWRLALRCTFYGLDPRQLLDVVEDFLC